MTSNIIIASLNLTSSCYRTVAVIASLIDEESKAPDTSNSNGITPVGYRWDPGFSWMLDQELDYQKYYLKADLRTDKYNLIANRSFYNFLSEDTEVENPEFAERLFNNSHIVAEIKDILIRTYPYNSLHDNRGIGDLEIRPITVPLAMQKTDDAVIL